MSLLDKRLLPPSIRVAAAAPALRKVKPTDPFAVWTRNPVKGRTLHMEARHEVDDVVILHKDRSKRTDQIALMFKAAPKEVRDAAIARPEDGLGDVLARFILSDDSVDSYNSTLSHRGWEQDLPDYRRNPVVLFVHDGNGLPVGQDQGAYVDNERKALIGMPRFLSADLHPFGAKVGRFVAARILRAVSVGFEPIDWDVAPERDDGKGMFVPINFKRMLLREQSVCPVPANRNALLDEGRLAEGGLGIPDVVGLLEDMLDGTGHMFLPRADVDALRTAIKGSRIMIDMTDVGLGEFALVRADDLPVPGAEGDAPAMDGGDEADSSVVARCPACGYEGPSEEFMPQGAPTEEAALPAQASADLDNTSRLHDPDAQEQLRKLAEDVADQIEQHEIETTGRLP